MNFQYKNFYGYERGEDGEPKIIPGEAEVVRRIYDSFLAGQSLRMIQERMAAKMKKSPPFRAERKLVDPYNSGHLKK